MSSSPSRRHTRRAALAMAMILLLAGLMNPQALLDYADRHAADLPGPLSGEWLYRAADQLDQLATMTRATQFRALLMRHRDRLVNAHWPSKTTGQ